MPGLLPASGGNGSPKQVRSPGSPGFRKLPNLGPAMNGTSTAAPMEAGGLGPLTTAAGLLLARGGQLESQRLAEGLTPVLGATADLGLPVGPPNTEHELNPGLGRQVMEAGASELLDLLFERMKVHGHGRPLRATIKLPRGVELSVSEAAAEEAELEIVNAYSKRLTSPPSDGSAL